MNKIGYLTDESEGGTGDPVALVAYGSGSGPLSFQVRTQGPNITARNIVPNRRSVEIKRGMWRHAPIRQLALVVWGGRTNDVVRQEMYLYIDRVYISGR